MKEHKLLPMVPPSLIDYKDVKDLSNEVGRRRVDT